MRKKRGAIHAVIFVVAIGIAGLLFAVPLLDAASRAADADTSYMALCGVLAKALSREKNVGLALTLLAMVMGFGGVIITALLTPFVRSMRRLRDGIGVFSGLLTLLPLVLIWMGNADMLSLGGAAAAHAGQNAMTVGGYVLASLSMLLILLCTSGLLVGLHVRTAAVRASARPKPVPKPEAVRSGAQSVQGKRGGEQESAKQHSRHAAEELPERKAAQSAEDVLDLEVGKEAQEPPVCDLDAPLPEAGSTPGQANTLDAFLREVEEEPETTVVYTPEHGIVCGVVEGREGVYAGARIELGAGEELLFGRNPRDTHVVIDKNNADISRRHCSVYLEEATGKFVVTDYSRNGTFARTAEMGEEMRLPFRKATRLPKGTVLRLGRQGNVFVLK